MAKSPLALMIEDSLNRVEKERKRAVTAKARRRAARLAQSQPEEEKLIQEIAESRAITSAIKKIKAGDTFIIRLKESMRRKLPFLAVQQRIRNVIIEGAVPFQAEKIKAEWEKPNSRTFALRADVCWDPIGFLFAFGDAFEAVTISQLRENEVRE
jgi:hypothetical protein